MAFMGILVLAWVAMLIFIAIVSVIIFVFIPCLIIYIINLVQAIRKKWPRGHTIAVIITGIILNVSIAAMLAIVIFAALATPTQGQAEPTSSEAAIALLNLLSQINY